MTTFTVWTFEDPRGAKHAISTRIAGGLPAMPPFGATARIAGLTEPERKHRLRTFGR
jgi:hypothetical protein